VCLGVLRWRELFHRARRPGRGEPSQSEVRQAAPGVRGAAPGPRGCYDAPMPFTSHLAEAVADDLLERFLRYVRIDTQSRRDRTGSPSTPGQLELGALLARELEAIGVSDVSQDENGYVFGTVEKTVDHDVPVIGLLAHLDTSPEAPGAGVEPIVHRDYDVTRIALPRGGTVLDPADMADLASKRGHDIVTSSGDTLLGADDKAGVAEIMAAVAHLVANPDLPRPTLRIGFTPDEEVGMGASLFDVQRFGALCAYTLDGGEPGELQDETFTGTEVTLRITGVDIHTSVAYGKLVNAARLAAQVVAALPSDRLTPETTRGREGFIHPTEIQSTAVHALVRFIVRDFEEDLLADHIELLKRTAAKVVGQEPRARLEVEVRPQYPNMRVQLEAFPDIVTRAEKALLAEGIDPVRTPIRGGTDGSLLSSMGLPTPNLFTGGSEWHSVREWASVQDMASAAATVVRLAEEWTR
jgi:tripeptide aminopeptidase